MLHYSTSLFAKFQLITTTKKKGQIKLFKFINDENLIKTKYESNLKKIRNKVTKSLEHTYILILFIVHSQAAAPI